jgi:glycosyltransferase involved in cell wall biosynthesis
MNETLPTVVVHDFSGHPFQAELSRKLSVRGFAVEHLSAGQYVSGKGHLERQTGDASTLTFASISLHLPFQKYAPWARLRWERAYGRAWVERLRHSRPTAVIACNLPLFSLWMFARYAHRTELPWILWHQDIYSHGMADEVSRRFARPIARLGARMLGAIEAHIVRSASHVVAIGDAFTEVYDEWGVDPNRVEVIPNWSPLDRIFPVERRNRRSSLLFADEPEFRLVYAGTLGRKHNPDLLPQLVEKLRARGVDAQLAVVSEGEGAEVVRNSAAAAAGNVTVLGFQSADYLPDVLGSADALVALLEPNATKFSIPSKVLSYMAAGRPVVGLMPADNPAAIDIAATGGFVAEPDGIGVSLAADWLVALAADRSRITAIGNATRERAEKLFDAEQVGDRFATTIRTIARIRQDIEADAPKR